MNHLIKINFHLITYIVDKVCFYTETKIFR
jgi:hypothetical protein